jgi:eukaryotic-like serine/threonine-protein kinase
MTAVAGPTEPLSEGSVIGRKYRLESLLGEGGMGSVWRAFNVQLEVPVAIKVLRADLAASELGERLRVEARAAAKLVHPSIVRVFDIGDTETGDPFIVMELLNGESLGDRLEREESLSPQVALQLLLPIAEALALAHSRGVVHRDLKPDNIFLAAEGGGVQPKLLDFGIAKLITNLDGAPTLTQTGTLLGSPDYMSPEQAYGRADIDQRSDVWAFCVVLYETLAGIAPFGGDSNSTILRSVVQDKPVSIELLAKVDPKLASLIHWGLAKDRDERPASILDLGRALAAWMVSNGIHHDVTGSSLDTKWLGPAAELRSAGGTPAEQASFAQATFMSVGRHSPAPSPSPSDAAIELPPRHETRWLPLSLALSLVVICVGLLIFTQPASGERLAASASPDPTAPTAAPRAPASQAILPVDALPLEPRRQRVFQTTPSAAETAAPKTTPAVPAATLPRALPRWSPPPRQKRTDLLDPY